MRLKQSPTFVTAGYFVKVDLCRSNKVEPKGVDPYDTVRSALTAVRGTRTAWKATQPAGSPASWEPTPKFQRLRSISMHERSCLRNAACRRTRAQLLSFAALHATQTTVPTFWTHPTHPFIFIFFLQTDLVRYRASRRRTTNLVVPILEAPTHTLSE